MALHNIFSGLAVGGPGLAALGLGGAAFFAMLLRTRLGAGPRESGGKRSQRSALGIFLQMLAFAGTGFGRVDVALEPASPAAIAGAAAVAGLMAAAVLLFSSAARAMGANWSLIARTRADHELVTGGVFAHVRHPIYLAMGLFLLALAVGLGHEASLLFAAPLFALGTWIRVREEERLLRARFGDAYERYAASVKRFVPGLL
ncbi:MAG TPA: isoprenylcysteine carboxylmethyltransferase family protein [Allosphingosinicella sp.]|jgi:protein-S-isoprenylcysteine O-methyltransferase Ste14